MIKINLATKPGLQDETVNQGVVGESNDIFKTAPPAGPSKLTGEQLASELQATPATAKPEEEIDRLATVEANLKMLEQAESEEFVPQHPSQPPEKVDEVEEEIKSDQPSEKPRRSSLFKVLSFVLIVAIIIVGGYWAYNKYLRTPTPSIPYTADEEEILTVDVPATPAPETSQPVETAEVQLPPSQIDEIYLPNIAVGVARSQLLGRILEAFPIDFRLQYLKLTNEKISFLIYVNSEEEAQRAKTTIQNLPGIYSTRVFYTERISGTAAPDVQIMAILNAHDEEALISNIGFQDDMALSQIIWAAGKRSNLTLQPLIIYEPQATKPRLAEIRGSGSVLGIISLMHELAELNLNLSIEQVLLNSGVEAVGSSDQIDFSINTVIYPRKL
ncbi:MAG: hypothetical protein PHC43_05870 [Candidatus Marinimicrobia bacterium]|nr:hypothetical protein [Candidatus Neomarinimicrobiota bacterium]